MSVNYVSSAGNGATAAISVTIPNFTIGSESNRFVLIAIHSFDSTSTTDQNISSGTFDGVGLSLIKSDINNNMRITFAFIAENDLPGAGSYDIVINTAGIVDAIYAEAHYFWGDLPIEAFGQALNNGVSSSPSITTTHQTTDPVTMYALTHRDNPTRSISNVTSGLIEVYDLANGQQRSAGGGKFYTSSPPGNYTQDFTISGGSSTWFLSTVELNEIQGIPLDFNGFEEEDEFGSLSLKLVGSVRITGYEDDIDGQFGSISVFRKIPIQRIEKPEAVTLVDFPGDGLYYGSEPVMSEGNKYKERINVSLPSVSEEMPEFFAGLETPQISRVILNNDDEFITNLRKAGKLKRGNKVIIKELWRSSNLADDLINSYRGIISNSEPGFETFNINCIGFDLDILSDLFPLDLVDTDKFSDATDLGFPIPWLVGQAKKIPCSLIKSQDDQFGIDFRYLVGEGDYQIDAVYRDNRFFQKYNGSFGSGSTASTAKLSASDTQNDDFYINSYVRNNVTGEARLITDYVSSTKIAQITPNWTVTPASGQSYTITRYKKDLQVINGITYTYLQFAIAVLDGSGSKLTRNNISADVTRLDISTNPIDVIKELLLKFTSNIDTAGFTAAASFISGLPLRCDGGVVNQRTMVDILNEIAPIGRCRLSRNAAGNITPHVDGAQEEITGTFRGSTISSVGTPREQPIDSLWKDLTLDFRKQFDVNSYTLKTDARPVSSQGRRKQTLSNDFLFDKVAAGLTCDYIARVKANYDESIPFLLTAEGRGVKLGDLINIDLDEYSQKGIYEVVARRKVGSEIEARAVIFDSGRSSNVTGQTFDDPIGDDIADFTDTPATQVTNFQVTWVDLIPNVSVKARLTWTKPTVNYKDVQIAYGVSPATVFNNVGGRTEDVQVEVPGLTPGVTYQFSAVSYNKFNKAGQAVIISELAPGDTSPPSDLPQPTIRRFAQTIEVEVTKAADSERVTSYVWEERTNAGALIKTHEVGNVLSLTYDSDVDRKFRVKAKDNAGNLSVNWSPYSSTENTQDIVQGDVVTSEMYLLGNYYQPGESASNPAMAVTITTRNKPVEIICSWVQRDSAGLIVTLTRNSTTIYSFSYGFPDIAEPGPHGFTYRDTSPGTGSRTYELTVGNNPGLSNRSMVVKEMRVG